MGNNKLGNGSLNLIPDDPGGGQLLFAAAGQAGRVGETPVQPLGNADLVFSAQARYTDEYYQNQDASRLIMRKAGHEYNARIAYEPRDAQWSVALWGKNLSNEFASTGGFDIAGLGVGVIYPNVPRTYGVEFSYRFW